MNLLKGEFTQNENSAIIYSLNVAANPYDFLSSGQTGFEQHDGE